MQKELSRRKFLSVGGIAAAGLAVPGNLPDAETSFAQNKIATGVCIVGGGFAGLTAGLRLKQAGVKVIVLEARDRVGGRVWTTELKDGSWLDLGGQWVGPNQDRFLALIQEMSCETYPSPQFGESLVLGITKQEYVRVNEKTWDKIPGHPLIAEPLNRLQSMADSIESDAPWRHTEAQRWDGITYAEWLDQNVPNANARQFLAGHVGSIPSASPQEISLLQILFLIKSCGGFDRIMNTQGGAQQDRIIGGAQTVAKRIAQRLSEALRFGQPVRKIEWSENKAVVFTDHSVVVAKHVIVTGPPNLAAAIEYEPSLPTNRVQVTQRWPQGLVIKVQMIFDQPFWREDGLSGDSFDYVSILQETEDGGAPQRYSKLGVLTSFIYSAQAREVATLTPEVRKNLILSEASKRFGKRALNPVQYFEMNWSTQTWTRGCFGGFLTPGATFLFRSSTRDPVGPIHWGGTETSTIWPTYIDGAVRSGERAAREILEASSL